MSSWVNDLKNFYHSEQANLEQNYPGLKFQRLLDLVNELVPTGDFNFTQLNILKKQLSESIPLQYISRQAYFYKMSFYVDERVLIPRSESEIMVEKVAAFFHKNADRTSVLEMGVGSGALLISILNELKRPIKAFATDLSFSALEVAKLNSVQKQYSFHPETTIQFYRTDRLLAITDKVDALYSNPPYIKKSDIHLVHAQVQKFEPEVALFLENDQYDQWFLDFFQQAQDRINSGGFFMMEGHENQLDDLKKTLEQFAFNDVKLIKDYTDRNRFITAYRK